MEIKPKFAIEFRPDSLQRNYQNLESIEVGIEILGFSDGSKRVTIPEIEELDVSHRYCTVTAFIESLDDLMIVGQIKDIINRVSPSTNMSLTIDGTLYTRYDRVMLSNNLDAFGAKVFANLVNSLNFDNVTFKDAHSHVIVNLVNNSVNIDQKFLMESTVPDFLEFGIICPDAGAKKKLANRQSITFDKARDPETGQITGMKLESLSSAKCSKVKEFLVVDDICEGGRTFIELAKCFEELKNAKHLNDTILKRKNISLYVTHGIFSNGAIEKLLGYYSKIYVYNMKRSAYYSLTRQEQEKVIVKNLLDA